jgi:hypothetical protein
MGRVQDQRLLPRRKVRVGVVVKKETRDSKDESLIETKIDKNQRK